MTSIQIDINDGLSSSTAIKGPCRVATTTNITLSGEQTIDGVAVVTDDRVLVKNQSTASENGIYVADTGPWRRSKDFDKTRDVRTGTMVNVTSGTAGAGQWQVSTANPITIGTTSISFTQVVQPGSPNLTSWAAVTRAAGFDTFVAAPSSANFRTLLTDEIGTGAAVFETAVIQNAVAKYGADGGGVVNNVTPFTTAGAAGKLTFIPVPSVRYEFATPLNGYDIGGAWLPDPAMTWVQLTDSGQFNLYRGRRTGSATGANIWRLSDRLFLGEAASKFAGDVGGTDGGNSWVKNQADCPWYLPLNAAVLWTSGGGATPLTDNSPYGFVSAVKTSLNGQGGIAFGAAVVADLAAANAWGLICEMQAETGSHSVYGIELDLKNKGANSTITPNAQVVGTYGLWAVAGGDVAFGGSPTNPSTAAVVILRNAQTWNSGIVFMKDSLTAGEAMALSSEGVGGAHGLNWYNAAGNLVFKIDATATDTVPWELRRGNGGLSFIASTRITGVFVDVANAVNYLQFSPSATTAAPVVESVGSDGNINLILKPKGTGAVTPSANDGAALGTTALQWSDLFLATGGVVNWANGDVTITHAADALAFAGAANGYTFSHVVTPAANDGAALGTGTVAWSDLFLASGGVINFNNGDCLITHSADTVTFTGANNGWRFGAAVAPNADDNASLGLSGLAFSDLFLASGAVINFAAGDVLLTHSANTLAATGASSGYTFDALVQATQFNVGANKVVGARDTGWTAMTGTPEKGARDTATVTLPQLAGQVMAIKTALTTHGLIGA